MAIGFVRENTAIRNNLTAATYTHTVTTPASGNVLLLTLSESSASGASGATPSGVATTWTRVGQVLHSGILISTELWVGVGPFSGTTITITKVNSGNSSAASSQEFSGMDSSARSSTGASAEGAGGSVTGATAASISAGAVGDLLICSMAWRDAASVISTGPGGGYNALTGTGLDGNRTTIDIVNAYQIAADLSAHQAVYTTSSGGGNSYATLATIFPATVAAVTPFTGWGVPMN